MMEVKLSHRRHLSDLSLPRFHFPNPKTTFPSPSLKWWVNSKKHFTVLAERWRFHIQDIAKGQSSPNPYSLHVVKEGETLTSISKQYGVSRYSVSAANKNILDVDLVFEGQFLNIPASAPADTQVVSRLHCTWCLCLNQYQVKKCESPSFDQLKRLQNSMKIMDGALNQKPFIMVTTHHLPHAKAATGYFLVLVPAFAFCIRCVIGAFQTRACRNLGCQAPNESRRHHDVHESKRWKHALSDIREPDNFDGEPILNSTVSSPLCSQAANILLLYNDLLLSYQMRYCTSSITNCEMEPAGGSSADQDQNSFEEVSNAYDKLELEYQIFLSECGISNSGYWRGDSAG
ncbi:hypothetical protein DKX38_019953 [Salix brachista]|uniref:LysM domain-containing protein n=1 Tax=Salix brachista TaxID=2182728 RepID=A0A5N5KHM9_9ROSI|nr:hypothetical protein DKX38_019953 [Salix brachista]